MSTTQTIVLAVLVALLLLAMVAVQTLLLADQAQAAPACVERWRPLVERYFDKYSHLVRHRHIRAAEVETALRIIYRESRGYPQARNGAFCGLFQVWRSHFRGRDPFRPISNIATAAMLWSRTGWTAWSL